MLDWISGTQRSDYMDSGDDSKLPEPPETPGPVFALRAFKSAIFGTPGIEEEYDEDRFNRPVRPSEHQQKRVDPVMDADENPRVDNHPNHELKPNPGRSQAPMGSPTKSILLTPGTAATRRKTVSFGDAVVDNEQKKSMRGGNTDKSQQQHNGPITSQWNSRRPPSMAKPRSKLTQSLLDARETKINQDGNSLAPTAKKHEPKVESSKPTDESDGDGPIEEDGDETVNLDDPRSQSGQYWKSEFENYRARTDREIRKLIQYRSVAKSYARKKDLEALRLAEKLKAEEAKVAEVERKVSELASGMVGASGGEADREEVVKDLVNQTALALRYKQKVNALRKVLQRHGVVISDDETDKDDDQLTRETLGKADKERAHRSEGNIHSHKTEDQESGMEELRQLVRSSERKAAELEKENTALKNNMLRVKEEMRKYEERRTVKEAERKKREQKLETRNEEYRERLRVASKERRESENALKSRFDEEKKKMAAEIESLQNQLSASEHKPSGLKQGNGVFVRPSKDQFTNALADAFAPTSERRINRKSSTERDDPEHLGRNSQSNRHSEEYRQQRVSSLKSKRSRDDSKNIDIWAAQEDSTSKSRDVADFGPSTANPSKEEMLVDDNIHQTVDIPPSSPPELPSTEPSLIEFTPPIKQEEHQSHTRHQQKIQAFDSPRPSMVPFRPDPINYGEDEEHRKAEDLNGQRYQVRLSKRPSAVALDRDAHNTPMASVPDRSLLSSGRKGSAAARRDAIPADRLAAANARLHAMQKEGRKSGSGTRNVAHAGGKENAHPVYR